MAAVAPIVGIDLGTTNCVTAYLDHTGRPQSLPNFEGAVLTPSAVLIEGKSVVVGREAQKAAARQPDRFGECFKRDMGRDAYSRELDGSRWRPEMLSAMVLRRLRKDVLRLLGPLVTRAVITVPAYFDERRRRATRDAALIAGWQVEDILNEPTAAALCYVHALGQPFGSPRGVERLLIYDLGGGTFDTTILEVRPGPEYQTLATEGEVRFGGYDWDARLADHLAEQYRAKTGYDPRQTDEGKLEFVYHARALKHTLTTRSKASAPCVFGGGRAVLEATRELFERLTADLLERTRCTVELVLRQAQLTGQQIDHVLLTGGATRMPQVPRMMHELMGRPPDASLSPDEAVAHGAALYAQLRQQGKARVVNVSAHTYGIVCFHRRERRQVVAPLIPRNSPLPFTATRMIPVGQGNSSVIPIAVREGDSDDPALCEDVGEVRLTGLPTSTANRWVVGVTLECLANGTITVQAGAHDAGNLKQVVQRVNATLVARHGMSPEEVAQARQKLDTLDLT